MGTFIWLLWVVFTRNINCNGSSQTNSYSLGHWIPVEFCQGHISLLLWWFLTFSNMHKNTLDHFWERWVGVEWGRCVWEGYLKNESLRPPHWQQTESKYDAPHPVTNLQLLHPKSTVWTTLPQHLLISICIMIVTPPHVHLYCYCFKVHLHSRLIPTIESIHQIAWHQHW